MKKFKINLRKMSFHDNFFFEFIQKTDLNNVIKKELKRIDAILKRVDFI